MGILKDWYSDNNGYFFKEKAKNFFSINEWRRLHRWRKQRANRGWSDRDTWGAGEHIAKITAEMLQHLNDNAYTDWPEWFKLNVKEKGKGAYDNLQQVIDDINAYLEFTEKTWADDLECDAVGLEKNEDGHYAMNMVWRYKKNGKKLTEQQIKAKIKSHAKKEMAAYKKATKAMQFFGRHFAAFWD